MSTIAAISTPIASGGISVIRISGENAFGIADKLFVSKSGKKLADSLGYTCHFGNIRSNNEDVDECIATIFRAPHSYTGENVVELSCHGGLYLTKTVLRMVLDAGAMPAAAGEFTRRAFLNGKIDLTKAEAVMDIINADNQEELSCANALHNGSLYKKVRALCDRCIEISADLAAWSDFPDEDIPEVDNDLLQRKISDIIDNLQKLINSYDYGLILKEGIRTVILGKPNVGKSTFMNLLSGCERSIVCDVPGTTRDVIEETVMLGGFKLRLADTAGIRDTGDVVEKIGVERAFSKLEEAQLVLAVFDLSTPLDNDDISLLEKIKGKTSIAVLNKNDCDAIADITIIQQYVDNLVEISAKNSSGLDSLADMLDKLFEIECNAQDMRIFVNERQKRCVENALDSLTNALEALRVGEFNDIIAVLIDECSAHLLSLTGENVLDSVVDEVFSKFCVGK